MKKTSRFVAAIGYTVATVSSSLLMALPARATTLVWDGGGADSLASTALNWDLDTTPVCNDSLTFPASTGKTSPDIDLSCTSAGVSDIGQIVFNGDVAASSHGYTVTGDDLNLASGILAQMSGTGGDHQVTNNITLTANQTFSTDGSNTLVIGSIGGTLDTATFDLTLFAGGGSIQILSDVTGSGALTVTGTSSDVKLLGDASAYTGATAVTTGTFIANNTFGGDVTVSGGTLKGIGTVGAVAMDSGAVAPGLSPGVLSTGNLTFTGGVYDVELGGTTAGEFDQLNVTGSVDLGAATSLNVMQFGTYNFADGDSFVIINNDGADAITGTFLDLPEGATIPFGIAADFIISYVGGDGNDVTITARGGTPAAPDTGFRLLKGAGLITLLATVATTGALVLIARRYEKVKNS